MLGLGMATGSLLAGCAGGTLPQPQATSSLGEDRAPQAPEQPTAAPQTVKVGLLLPLSAGIQMSLVAKGLQQAAELSLFERNISGLQLVVRDDKGTAEGAAAATTELLADGAELLLGPLLSTSVKAVAPIARRARVPVIAFSNDAGVGGDGVHLLSFFPAAEVARATSYAIGKGRMHLAALIPQDTLGQDTEPAFRRAVEAGGARLALVEHYPVDMSGVIDSAKRVIDAMRSSAETESPIDAVFLPSSSDNVPRLVAMLRHNALDTSKVKLIVTGGWDNPAALREAKVHGAWLAGPDPGGWRELAARFAKAHQAMPPRLASLVYDAVSVAAAFASQPRDQRYIAGNLTRPSGFAGIDGPFRLTSAGPVERSLAMFEVTSAGLTMIDPPSALSLEPPARPVPIGAASGPVPG
jgi:ABC-type branched-subunit amino acid transport system substrate-binding protein